LQERRNRLSVILGEFRESMPGHDRRKDAAIRRFAGLNRLDDVPCCSRCRCRSPCRAGCCAEQRHLHPESRNPHPSRREPRQCSALSGWETRLGRPLWPRGRAKLPSLRNELTVRFGPKGAVHCGPGVLLGCSRSGPK